MAQILEFPVKEPSGLTYPELVHILDALRYYYARQKRVSLCEGSTTPVLGQTT